MKVSYSGKVKKISTFPRDMTELRRVVQKKFANRSLRSPDQSESRILSDVFDNSANSNDNSQAQQFFNNQVAQRQPPPSKATDRIEWDKEILFYEDSEGDFNVISEDEDVTDAGTYITQRNKKALECTIVKRTMYDQMRGEQMANDLNQSTTWMASDQNLFSSAISQEDKKKLGQRQTDDMPPGLTKILQQMVKQSVECSFQEMGQQIARDAASENQSESLSLQNLSEKANNDIELPVEFDRAKYGADLAKMAVVTSGDEVVLEVFEGQEATLEFEVQNQAEFAWPFKPYLQNEKDHSQRQIIDEILHPGMKTSIKFTFIVPKGTNQKFYTIRLQLVDPFKYEKFDEQTLIGFCQIKPNVVPNLNFNAEDMQQVQEKSRPFRNTFQMSELSDKERQSQNSSSYLTNEKDEPQMLFDPAARADMIDRALNENCGLDTERSELDLNDDSNVQDLLGELEDSGSQSARKTAENNDKVLQETKALVAQLKLSLNANEADDQNAQVQSQMLKMKTLIAKADEIRQASPRGTAHANPSSPKISKEQESKMLNSN